MRIHRRAMVGGFLIMFWLCQMAYSHHPKAAEFYGWIDPNGTVVLTDDLSGLPPSLPRQSVWTYRYLDPPPSTASPRTPVSPSSPPPSDSSLGTFSRGPVPAPALDPVPPGAPAADSQTASDAPTGQLAMGHTLVMGVPLAPALHSGNQTLPLALLNRLPPGPEGLAQRLRELQALQARHFSSAVAPPSSGKARQAAGGQRRGSR